MTGIHRTFELYLDNGSGDLSFEALTCASREELLPAVRKILEERQLEAVEVRELGTPLFKLGR
jgi:hypothetical protein